MPSSHLILCHPLLLLPLIPPNIRVFSSESTLHEVAKVLEFQLEHHSFQRNPRADLLQDGLVGSPCSPRDSQKSLPQHHSSKASILRHSAFFTVQLSHPYMTTGKTIALTRWTFVDKAMFLLPLGLTGLISLQCKGLSRVFSNTTVQKHQFFGTQPSLQSNSHIHTWLLEKP